MTKEVTDDKDEPFRARALPLGGVLDLVDDDRQELLTTRAGEDRVVIVPLNEQRQHAAIERLERWEGELQLYHYWA